MPRARTERDDRWSPLLPEEVPAAARKYTVKATVWRYKGTSAWHFANLPPKQSAEIKARFGAAARGWGSIRVQVRIGKTQWGTSLFPDAKSGTYLFAIKADVRKAEGIGDGDRVTAQVSIV